MVRFLAEKEWVIDLVEHKELPERYGHLRLPEWLEELPNARWILPLLHQDELDAFVVLSEPRADMNFDWEDRDLLKTVGREAASYLRLVETTHEESKDVLT